MRAESARRARPSPPARLRRLRVVPVVVGAGLAFVHAVAWGQGTATPRPAPASASAPAAAPAQALDVDRVMEQLARNASGEARFVETRHLAMLDRPLVSTGELSFQAPGRFVKRTRTPKPETLTVDGTRLRIERGGRALDTGLDTVPEAAAVVGSLRGALLGDRAALERVFAVSATGTPQRWTLVLLPSDPQIGQSIAHIRIGGAGRQVLTIDTLHADGDRTAMTIEPIRLE